MKKSALLAAPALALAILEAAGIGPSIAPTDESPESWDACAVTYLQQGQEQRKIAKAMQSEREAEDAKVVEFLGAIGATPGRLQDHHRKQYRAARDLFKAGQ